MLRDFQINGAKHSDAMYKAETDMVTGMAVVKKDTAESKYTAVTSEETTADIFFVDRERIPRGVNAARETVSDYDEDFVTIYADEFVTLNKYAPGERFGTDQYDTSDITADTAIDTRVAFKDGKVITAAGASAYVFKGLYNDAGHTLAVIEVSDTAAENA